MKIYPVSFSKVIFTTTLLFAALARAEQSATQASNFKSISLRQGTYEVPVNESSLVQSSTFNLRRVQVEQNGNEFKLRYNVPIELTGELNPIQFNVVINSGEGTLIYENTNINCLADQSTLMCKVLYPNLKFNQELVERLLKTKFDGEELQKRLLIQAKFSTDPVGVVKIKLK